MLFENVYTENFIGSFGINFSKDACLGRSMSKIVSTKFTKKSFKNNFSTALKQWNMKALRALRIQKMKGLILTRNLTSVWTALVKGPYFFLAFTMWISKT